MLALRIISVYFGKDHMILLGAFGLCIPHAMTASVFDSAGQGLGARARAVRLMRGIRTLSMSHMIVAFRKPLRVEAPHKRPVRGMVVLSSPVDVSTKSARELWRWG